MNLNFKKELYSNEIVDILQRLNIKINGIYAKDELNEKNLKYGAYVVNLDNHYGMGTHWTCFYKSKNVIYYFDSFGFPPPQNEIDLFLKKHNKIFYNDIQIQHEKSILCGYFVIAFFLALKVFKGSIAYRIDQFQKLFNKDTKKNDKILQTFLLSHYNIDV